jgi:hypothetical protein
MGHFKKLSVFDDLKEMDQMNMTENNVNEEIIRRAIKRSDFKTEEKEKLLKRQDIIEALENVTDLPRLELEQIAREVRESYVNGEDRFFSIKHQSLIGSIVGFALVGIIAFVIWLF